MKALCTAAQSRNLHKHEHGGGCTCYADVWLRTNAAFSVIRIGKAILGVAQTLPALGITKCRWWRVLTLYAASAGGAARVCRTGINICSRGTPLLAMLALLAAHIAVAPGVLRSTKF
jgi:hypothetical protein